MTRESIARVVEKTGRTEEEVAKMVLATSQQNRLIEPEEVARAILWLCEPDSRGVNGQAIPIDGGSFL
jgi:NAD(P)-dependent dehydrogenase (short-subunit alcohol dehydrogenase family)